MPRLVSVRDDAEQALFVVDAILARREQGLRLKRQAVLFRAAHHSARLEVELTRRNIPFVKFGGLKFLEAAHVKDVLALMRFAQNPRDRVSGFAPCSCSLASVRRSPRASSTTCAMHRRAASCSPSSRCPRRCARLAGLRRAARERRRPRAPGHRASTPLCQWYRTEMERLFEDAEIRRADIDQLVRIGATYPSRERFLTALTLDPPDATSDEAGVPLLDEDYLILSTIHSAKGRGMGRGKLC